MKSINFTALTAITQLLVFILLINSAILMGQETGVMPTQISGANNVTWDANTSSYKFFHDGILRYEYSISNGITQKGGTFNSLKAYDEIYRAFLPSHGGGVGAILGGVERKPWDWDSGVTYKNLSHELITGDTVVSYWAMMANNDTCKYKYKMKIVSRTLIIKIEADYIDENSNKAFSVMLDRCEEAADSVMYIEIPYLPLFHILLANNIFTSFFADWEVTNASTLERRWPSVTTTKTSAWFAHDIFYYPKTNQFRNRLIETLYLTTSPNLENVFPNIPNPVSPYRDQVVNNILWDYRQPFGRLIRQPWNYLERLWNAGVSNLWVQIHDWQQYQQESTPNYYTGYDNGLPCVLPANIIDMQDYEYGGEQALDSVVQKARFEYGYRIGLHQNYVDYYRNAFCAPFGYEESKVALNSSGVKIESYYNKYNPYVDWRQSYLLKPSLSVEFSNHWSYQIQSHYQINGAYLDVHCNLNPSWRVDYDISTQNPGKFKETLENYRLCYSKLRVNHNGPVQGEGGYHFLYQGYVDDIEARIITPTREDTVYKRPLLVDFDMLKLRPKTFVHGVGYYPLFMGIGNEVIPAASPPNMEQVLAYIATELAFGHGGYIPSPENTGIDFIQHAQIEYNHVFSIQKDLAGADPIIIKYSDDGSTTNLKSVSDYIRAHPSTYNDITSTDGFMGQVRIEYNNGIVVYVNRHPTRAWQNINIGVPGGWFNYHANGTLHVGESQTTNFTLPPKNGWVVYVPSKTKVTFTNKIRESNPGGKMLVDNVELIPSGKYSYLKTGVSHNVKTLNERFVIDSIYKHNNWNGASSKNYLLNDFYLDQTNQQYDANFTGVNPVSIKTNLLDGGIGGNIQFKDPWYVEQDGSQPNTFKSWASPFSPTGAFGQTNGGVFLNQGADWQPPYYSVKAISPQPVTLYNTGVTSGRSHNFYFQNWDYDANKIGLQYPNALQTGVVLKYANATLSANLKGTQLSKDENAYANNSQRKFVRTNNGHLHCVYSSMNRVWYERSTNNGATWEIMNDGKPLSDKESKCPIINSRPSNSSGGDVNDIGIVFQEKNGDSYKLIFYGFGTNFGQGFPSPNPTELYSTIDYPYSWDANPAVAWQDNGDLLVVWNNNYDGVSSQNIFSYWFGNISGMGILFFDQNIIGCIRGIADFPSLSVNHSNDIFHLAWQENEQDICYAQFKRVWQGSNQVLQQITSKLILSSGNGFYKNYHPSIIALGDANNFSARICWIGERGPDGIPNPTEDTEKTVVFKSTDNLGYFWTFGNGVTSCSINKTNDKYAIAWASGNNNLITFADNSTLRPVGTINISGKDVQLSNGTTANTMYALAFNTIGLPYFMQTALVNFNPQPIAEEVEEEREGIVSDGEAQIFFNIGDIVVDNQQISFVDIPDTVNINSQQTANQYLVSESFSLNNNSEFFYSVRYGLTDSLAALGMLTGNANVNFRVELLDAATDELLGVFDEVTYDQFNLIPYENIAYQVNTVGIGERMVKLRLVINNNFNPEYSVAERYDSQVGVLAKKQQKQISYKGSLAITEYALYQNYPNPFNPTTTINYQLKEDGLVTLKIYDVLGSEVKTLVNEEKTQGRYSCNFNASDLASGVYIYQLRANDFVSSKKLILLK